MKARPVQQAESIATHCPYCALQCGMKLARQADEISASGDEGFSVNRGALCIKGWTATELLDHPERLRRPLRRNARGVLVEIEWERALDEIAQALVRTQRAHGRDAVAVLGGGSLTNEKAYLMGKFARVALRTANIDYNGRYCMSSAAAAAIKAFGIDRGLPFPIADIAKADVILLVGANPAETMPPLMQYFDAQRKAGGRLIVVDPRQTLTAKGATLHLRAVPGTDIALANGLLHLLIREGRIDEGYIASRTENFAAAKSAAAAWWPDRVERITGIAESDLVRAAAMLGEDTRVMILTARGPEQQSQGVNNVLAFINLALALGMPGKAGAGFGTITGQGNGQGGREHGQKADQLPGYRNINDPEARAHIARVWGVEESILPRAGKSAYELIAALGDEIKALFSLGFNFAVSSPDAASIPARIARLEYFCVADFFLTETAKMADLVLPSAMWAEEEGTMTNLEGRVLRRRRSTVPAGGARTDLEILTALAKRLGCEKQFRSAAPEAIFEELRQATRGGIADYSGITYARLDAGEALHWPCPAESHPGTPRMFATSFATPNGRARFHRLEQTAVEEIDADFPLYLTTGRVMPHYQSGAQTRRIGKLIELAPVPAAEIHPSLASAHGLSDGDEVCLATRHGMAKFAIRLTNTIRQDTIFVPFHWGDERSVNRLTSPALDRASRMPAFKVCAVRIEMTAREKKSGAHENV